MGNNLAKRINVLEEQNKLFYEEPCSYCNDDTVVVEVLIGKQIIRKVCKKHYLFLLLKRSPDNNGRV